MSTKIEELSFDDWLKAVFDHPSASQRADGKPWYLSPNEAPAQGEPAAALTKLERLFLNGRSLLAGFSDDQAAEGLWFLLSPGCSAHMSAITEDGAPLEQRLACLRAMEAFQRDFFAQRCPNELRAATFREGERFPNLPAVLYMWWDEFPRHGEPRRPGFDQEVLRLLKRLLTVPHLAVQESAIHGLGHWYDAYRGAVRCITRRFLRADRDYKLPEKLRKYADYAGAGLIR